MSLQLVTYQERFIFYKDLALFQTPYLFELADRFSFLWALFIWFLGHRGLVSEQVTTLSSPIVLLAHVLLVSASKHFPDHLILGRIYKRGRGDISHSGFVFIRNQLKR